MTTNYHFTFPSCNYGVKAQIIGKRGKKIKDLVTKYNHLFINLNYEKEIVIGTFGSQNDTFYTFYEILKDAALAIRRMKFEDNIIPTPDQLKLLEDYNDVILDSGELLDIIEKKYFIRTDLHQVYEKPNIEDIMPCALPVDPNLTADAGLIAGPAKKKRRGDV